MIMNMEQRENYIKNTVAYFREQIEERGFVRYSEIIEKCTFDGMVDYKMLRSIQWRLGQRLDITKYIKVED